MLPSLGRHATGRAAAGLRRLLTTATGQTQLLRDFIRDSLYHPEYGYFSCMDVPVGAALSPLPFRSLDGQEGYLAAVKSLYDALQFQWLTPSEILAPYYAQAVANFILERDATWGAGRDGALDIVEVGGGRGTLARGILDHLRSAAPSAYARCRYVGLEISAPLAALQAAAVRGDAGHACYKVVHGDACELGAWGPPSLTPCFVLAMEVLDNLPHDRAVYSPDDRVWRQTLVTHSEAPSGSPPVLEERLEPLQDELIHECLALSEVRGGRGGGFGAWWRAALDFAVGAGEEVFLPTRSLQLLRAACGARPCHTLIAADFDSLPETAIPGRNAPLVASTAGGRTRDHATYLVPPGSADIFFPTDFALLKALYTRAAKVAQPHALEVTATSMKTSAFMRSFGNLQATTTLGGYNPLLRDYTNTSFFIGQRN